MSDPEYSNNKGANPVDPVDPVDRGNQAENGRSKRGCTRRDFLGMVSAAAAATLATGIIASGKSHADEPAAGSGSMKYRQLGLTGEKVSICGGGFHIGKQREEQESIQIVRTAVDNGINFLDNSWDYNEGQSEIRMGKALRDGYREKVFLMTKLDGRDKNTAAAQLEESLRRLQTDRIDLVQMHEVIRMSDPDRIFAEDGALEALKDGQKAGKLRYIGFTGHKSPEIHLKMLELSFHHGFRFDTVQMPLNAMDAHFDSFTKKVLPLLVANKIGVLGMKPMGSGIILQSHTVTAMECLHYAMNLPTSVVITGCDSIPILEQALQAAKTFKPLDEKTVAEILARTEKAARDGLFERYKTGNQFDSTGRHPEWLG